MNLAELIKDMTGGSSNIIVSEASKGEVESFIADIKKAKEVLGWEPKIVLKDGIKKLLSYYYHNFCHSNL